MKKRYFIIKVFNIQNTVLSLQGSQKDMENSINQLKEQLNLMIRNNIKFNEEKIELKVIKMQNEIVELKKTNADLNKKLKETLEKNAENEKVIAKVTYDVFLNDELKNLTIERDRARLNLIEIQGLYNELLKEKNSHKYTETFEYYKKTIAELEKALNFQIYS